MTKYKMSAFGSGFTYMFALAALGTLSTTLALAKPSSSSFVKKRSQEAWVEASTFVGTFGSSTAENSVLENEVETSQTKVKSLHLQSFAFGVRTGKSELLIRPLGTLPEVEMRYRLPVNLILEVAAGMSIDSLDGDLNQVNNAWVSRFNVGFENTFGAFDNKAVVGVVYGQAENVKEVVSVVASETQVNKETIADETVSFHLGLQSHYAHFFGLHLGSGLVASYEISQNKITNEESGKKVGDPIVTDTSGFTLSIELLKMTYDLI